MSTSGSMLSTLRAIETDCPQSMSSMSGAVRRITFGQNRYREKKKESESPTINTLSFLMSRGNGVKPDCLPVAVSDFRFFSFP